MSILRRCVGEVVDLFVDDGGFATSIVLWLAACCVVLPHLPLGAWAGPLLFAGLAALFAVGTLRPARRGGGPAGRGPDAPGPQAARRE